MKTVLALLGALLACQTVSASYLGGVGFPYGGVGYGSVGYPYGYGVGLVEGCAEPVIPVAGGLVDARSYVDSYFPGSSYCGYGTYGPAYGGLGYPLDVYGPTALYPGLGAGCGYPSVGYPSVGYPYIL